jgi:hypothetical protein
LRGQLAKPIRIQPPIASEPLVLYFLVTIVEVVDSAELNQGGTHTKFDEVETPVHLVNLILIGNVPCIVFILWETRKLKM